ncbi:MAG: DEAD/DEAH box helicase family protein [Bacteroidota bacterium]
MAKAHAVKADIDKAAKHLPENLRRSLNWVSSCYEALGYPFYDLPRTALGEHYPRIVIKVPTGGGKTLLAVEAIREYQNLFVQRKTGLVVWIVPSETIYTQTIKKLRNRNHYLRQLLDQCSGGNTLVLEKGQRLSQDDIKDNLVILFVMIQSVSRLKGKESLKVFQDSGGYEDFFPLDHRYDLHKRLIEQMPNLDVFAGADSVMPQIKTSLGNAIRLTNALIIIDEIHKVFSDQQRKTIDDLNPAMVLGFSATPRADMNIIVRISGLELKNEDMIKLDMHIIPPTNKRIIGWQTMLKEIKQRREQLEGAAMKLQKDRNVYIRPIALIQVEATGKDQRGKRNRVHSLDAKDQLAALGVPPDEIAIKTSSQNDIEDVDLFSQNCSVRYIITKEALKEGWDCSFAYILGVIPNVSSNTSITQLIGRILRQPFATKTGIRDLDESYVYYAKGNSGDLIKHVQSGFKHEGLEDLVAKVRPQKSVGESQAKVVKIRKEFRSKYKGAFYLPVWLMIEEPRRKRKFTYSIDIEPYLDFERLPLSNEFVATVSNSLSEETKERKTLAVSLDEESHTKIEDEVTRMSETSEISLSYATRRFAEVIDNPFLARKKVLAFIQTLESKIGKQKVEEHFGFIIAELVNYLHVYRFEREEYIFRNLISSDKLVLAVSDDPDLGYTLPKEDRISIDRTPNFFTKYLYEDMEITSLNTLETKVSSILDQQEKLIWWFRNKASRGWYSIQGWRQNKIYPDFVAAKRKRNGTLELVYVLESKGEQLLGNDDTQYKNKVLRTMSDINVKTYQTELPFGKANDRVEFYLVEQGKEDSEIRKLFRRNDQDLSSEK